MAVRPADRLSTRDVAQRLGVSERTVYRWISSGDLRGDRLGYRTMRFTEAQVAAFLRKRRQERKRAA